MKIQSISEVQLPPIEFSVQAPFTRPVKTWHELARKVEDAGFSTLFVSDHPGQSASTFVALAAAASSTSTLRLGTYVLNLGAREPIYVAADAATVDVVSEGRVILGVGAGHTPAEWTMFARPYPSPKERVGRAKEAVDVVQRLLAGETVTFEGRYFRLDEAKLTSPLPIQNPVPLLIGGNNPDLLFFAAQKADVVAMSGLGRTLGGGHLHEMRWSLAEVDTRVKMIRDAAQTVQRNPVINLLIYHVEVTADRQATAEGMVRLIRDTMPKELHSVKPSDFLQSPFVFIGTQEELIEQITRSRARWGISSYTIRAEAIDAIVPLLDKVQ